MGEGGVCTVRLGAASLLHAGGRLTRLVERSLLKDEPAVPRPQDEVEEAEDLQKGTGVCMYGLNTHTHTVHMCIYSI